MDTPAMTPSRVAEPAMAPAIMDVPKMKPLPISVHEAGTRALGTRALGTRALEMIQDALEGADRLNAVRLMVLGGPSRGKTSTIASLRGESFDQLRHRPRGVELSVSHLLVGQRNADDQRERFLSTNENINDSTPPTKVTELASDALEIIKVLIANIALAYNQTATNGLSLRCWDFGGQREYEVAHEIFIAPRSILMLVFDLTRFEDASARNDEVRELCHWLQTVFALTPEKYLRSMASSLLIVGTRRDSCDDISRVPEYLGKLRECLLDNLDLGVTNNLDLMRVPMLAIENQTAVEHPHSSGLAVLETHLDALARQLVSESQDIPLGWLAFLETLRAEAVSDIFVDRDVIEPRMKGFSFPPYKFSGIDELQALLLYFRDLGDVVLFDHWARHQKGYRASYVVCLEPERVLRALEVIVAPEDVRCEGLANRLDRKNMHEGVVTTSMLKQKWEQIEGLATENQRRTLAELFANMDLFIKLDPDRFGVPSLLPSGWENWGWRSAEEGKKDVTAVTVFMNYLPFGLIATLIARLHRTIGEHRTDANHVRSNAVLLTLGMENGVTRTTQVCMGFDNSKRELHWRVRSDAHDFRVLYRCLAEFNEHMRERVNSTLCKYEHFFAADCPQRCASMGFRLMFSVPAITELKDDNTEQGVPVQLKSPSKPHFEPRAWSHLDAFGVAEVSKRCKKAFCSNANCQRPYTYQEAVEVSEGSAPRGKLRHSEADPYVVFISHAGAHRDKEWAEYLGRVLEGKDPSLRTFVDRQELTGSWETAPENIERAMLSASVGVFITSPELFGRKWTMRELRTFLDRNANCRTYGEKVVIFPIFHRLSFQEASDPKLFRNPKFCTTFCLAGFFDPERQEECSTQEAIAAMQKLCKFSGLEKKLPAMHEWSQSRDAQRYRDLQSLRNAGSVEDPDRELQGVTMEEFLDFAAERIAEAYRESRRTG